MAEEIIIDGINVSECGFFHPKYKDTDCHIALAFSEEYEGCMKCENNPNCYFKQLKHKEQECEELRRYHNKCCKENIEKSEQWLEKYNQLSRDFYNGKYCNKENCSLLKAKEQECEKKCRIEKSTRRD